jgi:hypothetical protein
MQSDVAIAFLPPAITALRVAGESSLAPHKLDSQCAEQDSNNPA